MRYVLLILAAMALGISAMSYYEQSQAVAAPDPRAEYYRGLYDGCLAVNSSRLPAELVQILCAEAIGKSVENDWYEKPSDGWSWPLTSASAGDDL